MPAILKLICECSATNSQTHPFNSPSNDHRCHETLGLRMYRAAGNPITLCPSCATRARGICYQDNQVFHEVVNFQSPAHTATVQEWNKLAQHLSDNLPAGHYSPQQFLYQIISFYNGTAKDDEPPANNFPDNT